MAVTKKRGPAPDLSLLSDADIARLQKKAKDRIDADRKKDAEERHLEELIRQERAKYDPDEELVSVMIDLPAFTSSMLIDGVYYNHGEVVEVTKNVASSLREQMSYCWVHERLSGNPNMREYKPVKEDSMSALAAGSFGRV
jgi:hypothetical protein